MLVFRPCADHHTTRLAGHKANLFAWVVFLRAPKRLVRVECSREVPEVGGWVKEAGKCIVEQAEEISGALLDMVYSGPSMGVNAEGGTFIGMAM